MHLSPMPVDAVERAAVMDHMVRRQLDERGFDALPPIVLRLWGFARSYGGHGYDSAVRKAVEGVGEAGLVAPLEGWDHGDSLSLPPVAEGSAPIRVPQAHGEGHVQVGAEVGGEDSPVLGQHPREPSGLLHTRSNW